MSTLQPDAPSATAIVPAAGSGKRFGAGHNKLFAPLHGEPVLTWTVRSLCRDDRVRAILLVGRLEEREALLDAARSGLANDVSLRFVEGGLERRDSVLAGLEAAETTWVLVHDGARPLLPRETLTAVIDAAMRSGAALCAMPATDTVKHAPTGHRVDSTIPREEVFLAQTPQAFRRDVVLEAYRAAVAEGRETTDDVHVLEGRGVPIEIVPGHPHNLKLTHERDLALLERMIEERTMNQSPPRVGLGFDLHRLVEGRPCILGGVPIPYGKGPLGHSDGDVLLHALTDAILGAAGLDDLGSRYSDRDPRWKDMDSSAFLRDVMTEIDALGFAVSNCDLVMIGDRPKLAPHREAIRARIAALLDVEASAVNVKGKTAEGLGPLGNEEAIAAQAVVMLVRRSVDQME